MQRLSRLLLDHDTMLRRRHRKTEFTVKKSLIIFTVRTHGKLDAVPLASEPQASRPVVLACGPLAYWPTGLQWLQPVPGDAPFWCCFEFRKAKFASKRQRLVRINVSAITEGLYLISANAHFVQFEKL